MNDQKTYLRTIIKIQFSNLISYSHFLEVKKSQKKSGSTKRHSIHNADITHSIRVSCNFKQLSQMLRKITFLLCGLCDSHRMFQKLLDLSWHTGFLASCLTHCPIPVNGYFPQFPSVLLICFGTFPLHLYLLLSFFVIIKFSLFSCSVCGCGCVGVFSLSCQMLYCQTIYDPNKCTSWCSRISLMDGGLHDMQICNTMYHLLNKL